MRRAPALQDSSAALSLVLTASLAATVDVAPGASAATSRTAVGGSASVGGARLDLREDTVVPSGVRRTAKIRTWKVRTIHYYETLPSKWNWSLRTAVAKWNSAGGRIRFSPTTSSRNAQLRIGYAPMSGADGAATLGKVRSAYVHLNDRYRASGGVDARTRYKVMAILAHELGHVLGFRHTDDPCSLMAPRVDLYHCVNWPSWIHPGRYRCRVIDTPLARHFIRRYGGRVRLASAGWCPMDPLTPRLTGVSFTGGTTSPVVVHWDRPKSVPAGSTLVIKRWTKMPSAIRRRKAAFLFTEFHPSVRAGSWQDEPVTYSDNACFQIQWLNKTGARREPQAHLLSRFITPVQSPIIGTPTYHADTDEFTFPAAVHEDPYTHLDAVWDRAHPSTCVDSPSGGAGGQFDVPIVNGQGTLGAPSPLPICVSFFTRDGRANKYSDPTFVTFTE